jgi:hypothetical protein
MIDASLNAAIAATAATDAAATTEIALMSLAT